MKNTKLMILLLCLALLLCSCGKDGAQATHLSFSESADLSTLNALNGKTVSITGYMATLSPLDGEYIYLMNMPYQSCPFCVPNTAQLANTMAVFAAKGAHFEFTDRPVQITGTLKVEDRVDDFGYSYNYYIADARYEIVDLSNVSAEYALYQSLAEDGVIADINAMFDYLLFVCQWPQYTNGYTDENGNEISYFLYPGDVENILADDGPYGYAAEAAVDYFPALIRRVEAISATGLDELTAIISDAQTLEQQARAELNAGNYTYDEAADQYALNDGEALYSRFQEVYLRFSSWLAEYEL